jgi:hypothetical protein
MLAGGKHELFAYRVGARRRMRNLFEINEIHEEVYAIKCTMINDSDLLRIFFCLRNIKFLKSENDPSLWILRTYFIE